MLDSQQESQLERNQIQGNFYAKKIEAETIKFKELYKEVQLMDHKILEKKESLMSSDGVEIPQITKKLKTDEYRLEKMKQRHNELLAEIQKLKEDVNASRKERVIFDNVFKKLEIDLKMQELEIKKQLFTSLQIRKEKENSEEQLRLLKSNFEKNEKSFIQEYKRSFDPKQNIPEKNQYLEDIDANKVFYYILYYYFY